MNYNLHNFLHLYDINNNITYFKSFNNKDYSYFESLKN